VRTRLLAALAGDRALDASRLGREAGVRVTVLGGLLDGRTRPTEADYDKLQSWLTRQSDPAAALSRAVKAKRKTAALTDTTLAGVIGVAVTELDDALHGRPVPPQAAERLSVWVAAV
jgi:hypothetical protein